MKPLWLVFTVYRDFYDHAVLQVTTLLSPCCYDNMLPPCTQLVYITNNPAAPEAFFQCADFRLL